MVTPSTYTHFKLNDDAANTVVDDTGTGNNDGISGVNTSNLSVIGKVNDCFEFVKANSEYVNIDAVQVDIAGDTVGSISFWLNTTSIAAGGTIFSITNSAAITYFQINTGAAGRFNFAMKNAGTYSFDIVTDIGTLVNNTWIHLVFIQNGTSPVVYINGLVANLTYNNQTNLTHWFNNLTSLNTGRMACYKYNNGANLGFLDGKIDDFRYYKAVLTEQDVKNIYRGGVGTEDDPPNLWTRPVSTQAIIIT